MWFLIAYCVAFLALAYKLERQPPRTPLTYREAADVERRATNRDRLVFCALLVLFVIVILVSVPL